MYREAVDSLRRAGIREAGIDARQLLEHFLEVSGTELLLHPEREVDEGRAASLAAAVRRRVAREPLQYIVGTREFWSLDFFVSPAVLIPRPETEFLLDRLLSVVRGSGCTDPLILDMCTGSGVIAVVLAVESASEKIIAVDRSPAALQVAARNIARHGQTESVSLVCSDLFGGLRPGSRFAFIVANPPYIADGDFPSLPPEVSEWEPRPALLAGRRGLDIIRRLAAEGHRYLLPGGWLFIEIGADQQEEVYSLFAGRAASWYDRVAVLPDWAGRPRVLQARRKTEENG